MKNNLNEVLKALNKKYGDGTISMGGEVDLKTKRVRTGIAALDLAIGGGLPCSAVVEFFGKESSAKTTAALITIGSYQRKGLICALVDTEHSFDPEWATTLGVDIDSLLISEPDTLEQAIDIVDSLTRSGSVNLVVYDSLAASVPMEEVEKSAEDQQMALQARLFSKMCRKLNSALQPEDITDATTYNYTTVLFINQVREKVGQVYARGYDCPGGHAIRHTAKIIVQFATGDKIKVKGNPDPVGIEIKFKVTKNKTYVPFRIGGFSLYYEGTVTNEETIVAEAIKHGLIAQAGPMYTFGDHKEKGKEKFIQVLKANDLFKQLTEDLYDLVFTNNIAKQIEKGSSNE